jgi:hypothetical protein
MHPHGPDRPQQTRERSRKGRGRRHRMLSEGSLISLGPNAGIPINTSYRSSLSCMH